MNSLDRLFEPYRTSIRKSVMKQIDEAILGKPRLEATHFIELWKYSNKNKMYHSPVAWKIERLEKELGLTLKDGGKTLAIFKIKFKE